MQGEEEGASITTKEDSFDRVHEDDAIYAYVSRDGIITPAKAAITPATAYRSTAQKTRCIDYRR